MKRFLFVFLVIPLLSFGQKTQWKIDKVGISGGYTNSFLQWNPSAPYTGHVVKGSGLNTSLLIEEYIVKWVSVRLNAGYQSIGLQDGANTKKDNWKYKAQQFSTELSIKGYLSDHHHRPYLIGGMRGSYPFHQKNELNFPSNIDIGNVYASRNNLISDKYTCYLLVGAGFEFNNRWFVEALFSRNLHRVTTASSNNADGYLDDISLRIGLNILKPSVTRAKKLGIMPMFE
ncbi:MAG: hypothetical protein GC180_04705 [Bacteroidetes bacterium]|nr:hypothetical protein [Bacteroidota bacterium]